MKLVISNPSVESPYQLADSFLPWLKEVMENELCSAIINPSKHLNRNFSELPGKVLSADEIDNLEFDSILLTSIESPLPSSPNTGCKKLGLLLFSPVYSIAQQVDFFKSHDFDLLLSEFRLEEINGKVTNECRSYLENKVRYVPPAIPEFESQAGTSANFCIIYSDLPERSRSSSNSSSLVHIANSLSSIEGFSAIDLSEQSIYDQSVLELIAHSKGMLLDLETLPPQELMIFLSVAIRNKIRIVTWSNNPFSPFREISLGIPTLEVFESYNPSKSIRSFVKGLLDQEQTQAKFHPPSIDLSNFSADKITKYIFRLLQSKSCSETEQPAFVEIDNLVSSLEKQDSKPQPTDGGDPFENIISDFVSRGLKENSPSIDQARRDIAYRYIKRTHMKKEALDWIHTYTKALNQIDGWSEIYSHLVNPDPSGFHTADQQLTCLLHLGMEEQWELAEKYINSGKADLLPHGKFDKFIFALWTSRNLFRKFLKPGFVEDHPDIIGKSLEFWRADIRNQSTNPTLYSSYSTCLIMQGKYDLGMSSFENAKIQSEFLKLCSITFPLTLKDEREKAKSVFSSVSFDSLMSASYGLEWCSYYLMNAAMLNERDLTNKGLTHFLEKHDSFDASFEKSASEPSFTCLYWSVFLKQIGLNELSSVYLEKTKTLAKEIYPIEDEMWLLESVNENCISIEPELLTKLSNFLTH